MTDHAVDRADAADRADADRIDAPVDAVLSEELDLDRLVRLTVHTANPGDTTARFLGQVYGR